MAGLQEENAALKTILCILERDPQADKGMLSAMTQCLSHHASTCMHQKAEKRKDYVFWRQFVEKRSIIPGCPGPACITDMGLKTIRPSVQLIILHGAIKHIHAFIAYKVPELIV